MKCKACKKKEAELTARQDKDDVPVKVCPSCADKYLKKGYIIVTL